MMICVFTSVHLRTGGRELYSGRESIDPRTELVVYGQTPENSSWNYIRINRRDLVRISEDFILASNSTRQRSMVKFL